MQPVRLVEIPKEGYSEYRYEVIFKAYKWDPQVEDHGTVARYAAVISPGEARRLEQWAVEMAAETMEMEEALRNQPALAKELGIPKKILAAVNRLSGYDRANNVRLMRFDFHPTTVGWAVSEVNSDVPGGLAEASILPRIAERYLKDCRPRGHVGQRLLEAFRQRVGQRGRIAFVHATAYSDDRQVMEFLSDHFLAGGMETLFAAPDHLEWKDRRAVSLLEGQEGPVDGIVRFFPLEWLENLPRNSDWRGYYDTVTPSCNHPIAILTQSKRLPLVWDRLGVDLPTWKELLPETTAPGIQNSQGGWILKPAFGRVGEGISIREVVSPKELRQIGKDARRRPKDWVAQRRFESLPLTTPEGEALHLCVGVFVVDGKPAGFYGRVSPYPRIDARAKDIPLLVSMEGDNDERQSVDL